MRESRGNEVFLKIPVIYSYLSGKPVGVGSEDTVCQPVAIGGVVCAGASGAHGCRGLSCRQTAAPLP